MTETKVRTPEEIKYLKRMEKNSARTAHKAARKVNLSVRAREEQEHRRELHAKIDQTGARKFLYTEEEIKMQEARRFQSMPLNMQTAMLAGKASAMAEREAYEKKKAEQAAAPAIETQSVGVSDVGPGIETNTPESTPVAMETKSQTE